ncbi:Non-catalytic module family DOC2 [Piromyces sp. E2]|nr:Non-catalytic module family DOC2 [Piromyces sp. E2]|eukprot:OUM66237.1 Non-catalytic module family DOC2 [Piromyces sp. E2]
MEKEDVSKNEDNCWSDILGYSCCQTTCNTVYTDKDGNWGVENNQWCGIIDSVCEVSNNNGECFAEISGKYKCCEGCKVWYSDEQGDWGVENNDWCSIKYSCSN